MNSFLNDKVIPKIMEFVNTKAMVALKNGLLYSMPVMMIGAIFLLIGNFPIPAFTEALNNAGITPILNQATNSTFSIIAMIAAIGIAYTYVKNEGYNGLPAGVIALCTYLILQPSSVIGEGGSEIGVIMKTWTGGQGMIAAIVSGLIVGWIYSIFLKKDITIKMPAGVPEGVSAAFTALIPGFVLVLGASIVYAIFSIGFGTTPIEWIYSVLQLPLQGLTDSFGGVIAMGFIIPSIFNVNEPVLFGTPIVLNPILAVPFMLMPILAGVIQYVAIYIGLCPMYGGVVVPWTTPAIISGFFVGGWRTALLQAVILVISFFVYMPFIKAVDKKNVELEAMSEE